VKSEVDLCGNAGRTMGPVPCSRQPAMPLASITWRKVRGRCELGLGFKVGDG